MHLSKLRTKSVCIGHCKKTRLLELFYLCSIRLKRVERSVPNLEPGTMRVYVTNGQRNGLNIGRKVGPCPGSRRRWVLGSGHACSEAGHAAHTYCPRFQVRA